MFEIRLSKRAEKEFEKLPQKIKQKFYQEFERLSVEHIKHPQVKKVENTSFGYRLRINRWRVLFALLSREKRIEVIDIFVEKDKRDYRRRIQFLE